MKKRDRKILVFSAKKRKENDEYDTYELLSHIFEGADGCRLRPMKKCEFITRFPDAYHIANKYWYVFISPVDCIKSVYKNYTELRNFPRRNQALKKLRGK